MLYLNPPYYVIDGVSLLPDHADPLQFYFLPLAPHLTMVEDATTKQQIPQLQVIRFAGETATGGFLNFDCNLGISQDRLDAIGNELRSRAKLHDKPKLASVPLVDGSVRMMLFGKESPPSDADKPKPASGGAPATAPAGPQFVIKINNAAKPSLYGDNQAAFSVQLDAEGVTILNAALAGEMSPIGIVYSLTYVGLRPAYSVRVSADWNRVQTHLSESFGVSTVFVSSESDKVIDKLIEDRVIVIEADTFVAEGDGADDVAGRRDQALNEVREMVSETFFQPSLEPVKDKDGWDKFADTVQRTSQLAATGGMGATFTMKSVDLTRIDQKSLNVNMSERTSVLRSIYPQGHLAGLLRIIEEQHLDIARFVMSVSLDDDFFKKRTVRVIPRAEFDVDSIDSMNVALTYEGETKNVVLDASSPESSVEWMSVLDGSEMKRDVEVSYEVGFKSVLGAGRPAALRSVPEVVTGDAFEVSPRRDGLYTVMPVPINAAAFPWDLYPTVELDAEYIDDGNKIHIEDHFVFSGTAPPQSLWNVFVVDQGHRKIRYRLRYIGADKREIDGDWIETDEALIRVADPFPRKRTFEVVAPSALFATVERAFVDVSYSDKDNDVAKQQSFEFSAQTPGPQTFSVELVDPKKRQVEFTVTLLFADGHTVQVPPSVALSERLVLHADMKGHRAVFVRCQPVEFATVGLREIQVDAKYVDDIAKLSYADTFALTSASDERSFEYDFADAGHDGFEYQLTHKYLNGLSKTTTWQEGDGAELVVAVQ
jgi:hypothetical protein